MVRAPTHASHVRLIGRQSERAALKAFLRIRRAGLRSMLIAGEPGIGKSSLWLFALENARRTGDTLLVARPAEPEARLSYGVLRDLLGGLVADHDPLVRDLPTVQRGALVAALQGESAGEEASWLAVAASTFSLLRAMAGRGRVLLAIDDLPRAPGAHAPSTERCRLPRALGQFRRPHTQYKPPVFHPISCSESARKGLQHLPPRPD